MGLAALLEGNRDTILGKWFDLIIATYPRVTSEFLAKQNDRFRNPVGHAISESIGPIYDQVVSTMDAGEILRALDGIIRIRSVQDLTPSEAVAFVCQQSQEFAELESRVDRVALLAFEKYTECREKLHEVRSNEIKSRTMKLLERANAFAAIPPYNEEATDDKV
jgi:hypothetical protein